MKKNKFLNSDYFEEQMKVISSNLMVEKNEHGLKKIMITSPMIGDGKNTISNGLAKELAKFGQRVVLVNANLRDNNVNPLLSNSNNLKQDLATFLEGNISLEEIETITYASSVNNLDIVPSLTKHSNASDLLLTPNMAKLLDYLESSYDLVLVNGPAMNPNSDGIILTNLIQNVLLVSRLNYTKREAADSSMSLLENSKANIIGIINNDVHKM